jgi:hypothetical protein
MTDDEPREDQLQAFENGQDIRDPPDEARALCEEANELVAIITVIVRNTKRNAARRQLGDGSKPRRSKKSRIPNS